MVRVFLFILSFAVYLFPQGLSVNAYTDTTEYMIGDYITLNFVLENDKGISFEEPSFRDSIRNVDIISINTPIKKEENGKLITTYQVVLSRYDSADVFISPITFYYWKGEPKDRATFLGDKFRDSTLSYARSNEVKFRVNALKVNVQEEIKDIKDPVTIPLDWKIIALFIVLGLAVIGALVYAYLKFKKKRSSAIRTIPILPPHVVALSSLNELDNKKLWQKGLIKEFHSEITGIIRRYFEERFKLPALEMTTAETVTLLRNTNEAKTIIEDTNIFFTNADLVKFAKFVPMNDVNEMMMKKAYKIVEQTVPVQQPDEEKVINVQ